MIIATAQTKPKQDNLPANLDDHYRMINMAADYGAELILFPEMSLTGYHREKANEYSFSENDDRIQDIKSLSIRRNITVIAGAPIRIERKLYIGAFIIQPNNLLSIYTKQFSHTGEEVYFTPSNKFNPTLDLDKEKISIAIFADISRCEHPKEAKAKGTTIYLAGIFFKPNEMKKAYDNLSEYSSKYNMSILMSNFSGNSWESEGGGKSGFWNDQGELIGSLNSNDSGIAIMAKTNNQWKTKNIIYV